MNRIVLLAVIGMVTIANAAVDCEKVCQRESKEYEKMLENCSRKKDVKSCDKVASTESKYKLCIKKCEAKNKR